MELRKNDRFRRRFRKTRLLLWLVTLCLFALAWHETRAYARLVHVWSVLFVLGCAAGLVLEGVVRRHAANEERCSGRPTPGRRRT